ncbi:MAG: Crp/Fnr family transcriptional regulator [Lysinibacillus sp.]|nr:Crp/Fnr family transcriptional regulator [Lysinibacillus sp.]
MVLIDMVPMNFNTLFEEHGLLLKIDKGNQIFQEGESADELFFIQKGSVQVSKETENGKELTLRICGPNSLLGECSIFELPGNHTMSAKALTNTELLTIKKSALEMLLTQQPSLMIEYIKWLQNEHLKTQSILRDLVMHGKKGALYSTLIRLANTFGKYDENENIYIDSNLTNSDIANLCSTSREMVNRMLNDLKKQGIISFDKSNITIHNLEYLKKEICCENCPLSICRID